MPNCSHHHHGGECNHHHFPQQNQWLLGCLKLTPGTDAIGDPRNLLRYPANLTQASRVVFSGVRGLEVVAPAVSLSPIVYFGSAVGALAMFLSVAFINSVNKYTEIQGVVKSFQSLTSTDSKESAHKPHYHLPRPIQALFHLPDSGYRYLAERVAPQDPQTLAKLKTCLFYGNLALTTTITVLGVVALVAGAGAVAATPVGWGLIGLSAVSAVTFVGYSAVKNRYTILSRQAYQEALYLNSETQKQNQDISDLCKEYSLLDPKKVSLPSFSAYLGLNKPKKLINYLARKNNPSQENPTTVSEVLLNSALLNFVATSNLEEQEKKDIVKKAQEKFKPKDNVSGGIDLKIVDSNEFLYEIATFLAKKEVEKIKDALGFDIDDAIKATIPLWQEKPLQAENSKNTFSSRSLALLQPKSKKYYDSYIQAQQLLACYRGVQQELAPKNNHGHGHGHGHGRSHDDCEHDNGCCGGHDDGHGHGHGHGHSHGRSHGHGHSHSHGHDGHGCCSQPEFAVPTDIRQFKSQLLSYANPNLYNGNRYLDALNRKLFGKGAQDLKLTLRGIKELTKKTAESVMSQILEKAKEEKEKNKIPDEGPITPIPKTSTKPLILRDVPTMVQSQTMPVIDSSSIETGRFCFCSCQQL